MIGRRYALVAFGGISIFALIMNVYFIGTIEKNSFQKSRFKKTSLIARSKASKERATLQIEKTKVSADSVVTRDVEKKIKITMSTLPSKYFKQNSSYALLLDRLLAELDILPNLQTNDIWTIPDNWPDARQLIPATAPELGSVLSAMRNAKITKADNAPVGTQLKIILTLESGVQALFKPQWYSRDTILKGTVYYGKDRHNAEIVAFHLSSLLGLRRVPLAVTRKLSLTNDIRKNAAPELYATMYQEGNDTCLYGVCYFCSPADPVCGTQDIMEGAVILWLPRHLKLSKYRHPWKRTYRENKFSRWETSYDYCDKLKQTKMYAPQSSSRLLDLVDAAIFDFLIDNGDRHHYELFQHFRNPASLLIDNGKSLGDPDVDHFDILAPLYQCCMIHRTTWKRLNLLSGGSLSFSLKSLLAREAKMAGVLPLITEAHLSAIERRLLVIYAVVESCLKQERYSNVILDYR